MYDFYAEGPVPKAPVAKSNETIEIISNLDLTLFEKEPYSIKLIQSLYKSKINLFDAHFKYQPGVEGMNEAKKKFLIQLNK